MVQALAVNGTSSKLLASSADHHIYMFDCVVPEREPVMYSGHVNSSFYVKSTFSPDGRFIMSGSTDNDVYVWDVANPLIPPLRLKGHTGVRVCAIVRACLRECVKASVCLCLCLCVGVYMYVNLFTYLYKTGEVSDVAWSATEFWKLASSSDDTTVRLWTIDRAMSAHMQTQLQGVGAAGGGGGGRGSGGVGYAEVPQSWSQPVLQSEEDRLTCHETMMFSDTVSSSQEPDYCEEDRSSASAILGSSAHSPTGQQAMRRMSPTSPPRPSVITGEINSGGGVLATPTTLPRNTRTRSSLGDDRGLNNRSPQSRQALLTAFFNPRMSALASACNSDDTLVEPTSSSPADDVTSPCGAVTGSGGGGGGFTSRRISDSVWRNDVNPDAESPSDTASDQTPDSRKRSRTHE